MIHVLCSRWGNKYSVDYVNKLYSMVSRHLPYDFKFYCQTEDTEGLNPIVEVLPFGTELPQSTPKHMIESKPFTYGLPRLWDRPKLNYFNPSCWGLDGVKIALDLDILIHNDMSPLLSLLKDKPITGRSWWHDRKREQDPNWFQRYGAKTNGGFFMWEGNMFAPIWNDLKKNWERIYFVYHGGSDNFLTHRHFDKFDFLPPSMFYSFNRGCKWPNDMDTHKIRDDKIICVFNTDKDNSTSFELHQSLTFPRVKELWT